MHGFGHGLIVHLILETQKRVAVDPDLFVKRLGTPCLRGKDKRALSPDLSAPGTPLPARRRNR